LAVPSNFASGDKKYDEGLRDLSASLLNPKLQMEIESETTLKATRIIRAAQGILIKTKEMR